MSENAIVILGNGISGVTCARHIRKNNPKIPITIVSAETRHFFSRTALMYIYMGHMKYEHTKPYADDFWEKNDIKLLFGWVKEIDFSNQELNFEHGEVLNYKQLVLATGSKPNMFGWPGQDLTGVQGLYSYQDLLNMEKNTKDIQHAVLVGGGLIGVEMAEMLASRKIPVTFLVREKGFWDNVLPKEEAALVGRHIREHHIDLKLDTALKEIIGDEKGRVKAVKTSQGEIINCQFVGLTAGVSPNIDLFKNSDVNTNRGILVDDQFRTNLPNVYAIGDCAEFENPPGKDRKNIEQVWYTGRMHGETLAHNLTHEKKVGYEPGIWFNSAKFFDIEYQTYGHVPPTWEAPCSSFYWESLSGKVALRFLFDQENRILGMNAFGWRMRHEFFDRAIKEGWKADRVIGQLDKANFNPEFHKKFYKQLLDKYNSENGTSIPLPRQSFIQKLIGTRS